MNIECLAQAVKAGNRRATAKAITLIESTLESDQILSEQLIEILMPMTGDSLRIGISGVPGVGKSTFIEAFGLHLLESQPDLNVAVIAVDPSSPINGGSILGDKTRMDGLSVNPRAFIRPSPAGRSLGGVSRRSRETIYILEAAGYKLILLETVGVGQSETVVASMVDFFVMLQMPNMGDELQGMKKGILELADLIVVNKCDGDLRQAALNSQSEHTRAFGLLNCGRNAPKVMLVSAIERMGLNEVWIEIENGLRAAKKDGSFHLKRKHQAYEGFKKELGEQLQALSTRSPKLARLLTRFEEEVRSGVLAPAAAARAYVKTILSTN